MYYSETIHSFIYSFIYSFRACLLVRHQRKHKEWVLYLWKVEKVLLVRALSAPQFDYTSGRVGVHRPVDIGLSWGAAIVL